MNRTVGTFGPWKAAVVGLALVGTALASPAAAQQWRASAAGGHTVTLALAPGVTPNYIFPLVPGSNFSTANVEQFEYLSYRPLFWFGKSGVLTYNPTLSLGSRPRFSTNGAGDTVAAVTLGHWRWSDGRPVTTRDVEFWINLLRAEKTNYGSYVPGAWPDIIKSVRYNSASTFTVTFNRAYNTDWLFYDELSQIIPIPQHAWDKTCASCSVGSHDLTSKGAEAVYTYLNSQAKTLATYGTNALWKTVDGAWALSGYTPSTGYAAFSLNRTYSGPMSGAVTKFVEVPFTSNTAEFDSLRAGSVDVGYLPFEDLNQRGYLTGHGYGLADWQTFGINYIPLNYNNPTDGPIVQQLYVRQALQSLIDQPAYIKDIFRGHAVATYGPVPIKPANAFASPQEQDNPYPFSVSRAKSLLRDNGWTVRPGGTSTCASPGGGRGHCGAGITHGQGLTFTLQYASGSLQLSQEMAALRSAASEAGIQLTLSSAPFDTIIATAFGCNTAKHTGCQWQIAMWGGGWLFGVDPYPSGEQLFKSGAVSNNGGYRSRVNDANIVASQTRPGLVRLWTYENYLAKQLPVIFTANQVYQITMYRRSVGGVVPQDPILKLTPESWTVSG
ncbi:MAG TPA: ABC transporter substrate-binding protein [Candidatus Micrarchaeia archaeon]|nr:ABC transporter substrate-binding protein [Candidatus Micrarchaeia archaeon]